MTTTTKQQTIDVTDIETDSTALTTRQAGALAADQSAPASSPMGMMMAALQKGATLEQVSQMMDLQDRWNQAQARKSFDAAFAAFKADGVKILKSRERNDGNMKGTRYAELNDFVKALSPALAAHGLTSLWKLTKDERDWIEVTCYLRHVDGHEESVSMGGAPDTGTGRNAMQARASSVTYLERYTFKAVTGTSESNDDDDGSQGANAPDQKALDLAYWQTLIAEAATRDDLLKVSKNGQRFYNGKKDTEGFKALAVMVKARGAELTGVGNA